MNHKQIGLAVAWLLLWVIPGSSQVTGGSISGTVKDSTGAVLPGTTVAIVNEDTGISRTVTSDVVGRYMAASLSPGNYKVTASLEGFQTEVRSGIALTIGRQAIVDFALQVGAVTQTVEVTGEAPLVETTQSTVSTLVNPTTINELPLNGRDLSQLVFLQPGVGQVESPAVATHRGYGSQVNIAGGRGDENLFLLDGTDISDFRNRAPVGPNGILFGAGSVREFQVLTSNFSAQYGRASGGIFNAVSKSGTNNFTGEIYELLRNSALDARNFFDAKRSPEDPRLPPFRRNQFGGGIGGPIVRDKTFFQASYEGLRSTRSTTQRPSVPGLELRQGILPGGQRVQITPIAASIIPFWPLPTPGGRQFPDGTAELIIQTPTMIQSDFSQGRIDHQISEVDSLFGRFTIWSLEQTDHKSTPGYRGITANGSRWATLSETHIFSPRALNTLRFAFNRNTLFDTQIAPDIPPLKFFPDSAWPGNLGVTGVMGFSIGLWPEFAGVTNRFEIIDDLVLTRGNHSIQFGGNFQRLQVFQLFHNIPNGSYSFRSFSGFLQNRDASQFRGTPISGPPEFRGDFGRGMRYWYFGGYLQDDWRILPNLTLNLGIRYDFQSVPTEVNGKVVSFRPLVPGGDLAANGVYVVGDPWYRNPSTKDFAPRVGFVWTPWQERSTTIRAGFGLFYSRIDARYFEPNRDGFISKIFSVSNPTHFPDGMAELTADLRTQVWGIMYEGLSTPHTAQWSLDIQQQLGASTVLSVGYMGNRGINLVAHGNYNAPATEFVDGVLTVPIGATRRNPNYEIFRIASTNTDSWYNGLMVDLRRRMASGLQFQLAYTFSKALSMIDSTQWGGVTFNRSSGFITDLGHLQADKGLASWDARNVFKFNYVYELPLGSGKRWLNGGGLASSIFGGWQLSGILTLKDGSPFEYAATLSSVLNGLTFDHARPNAKPGVSVRGIILGTPADKCGEQPCLRYYDPNSFDPPGARQLGNVGKNTGITVGIASWDASVQKNFSLTERYRLQFRAEAFNLLNRVNFGLPNKTVFGANGQPLGSTGVIQDTAVNSRELQLSLRLTF